MDPYLEDPGGWLDVHNTILTYLRDDLNERLGEKYFARTSERVLVESRDDQVRGIYPDLTLVGQVRGGPRLAAVAERASPMRVKIATSEFREAWLEVLDRRGEHVVTIVELLSASNKESGSDSRAKYLQKQREIMESKVSLVEIDLLRAGAWTVAIPEVVARQRAQFQYLVSVNRPPDRASFDFYPILLRDRLPPVGIPLAGKDPDVDIDLQSLVTACYDRGQYARTIDYGKAPVPRLEGEDAAWADGLLRGSLRRK